MSEQNSLLVTANRATLLGNRISLKMVQFLNEVKNQPAGSAILAWTSLDMPNPELARSKPQGALQVKPAIPSASHPGTNKNIGENAGRLLAS
jgi:hypothetical protein